MGVGTHPTSSPSTYHFNVSLNFKFVTNFPWVPCPALSSAGGPAFGGRITPTYEHPQQQLLDPSMLIIHPLSSDELALSS